MQPTHIAKPILVHAAVILAVANEGTHSTRLDLDDGSKFTAPPELTARYVPQAGDLLVTQEDGYQYVNPRDVFERKYREIIPLQDLVQSLGIGAGLPPSTTPDVSVDLHEPTEQARQLLADDHWLTQPGDNVPPAPVLKATSDKKRAELVTAIREAGMFALRTVSENGRVAAFDPDALLQNLALALLGEAQAATPADTNTAGAAA
jgi:hypothetical protein